MHPTTRSILLRSVLFALLVVAGSEASKRSLVAAGAAKPMNVWKVDDVRAGMKGYGRTVMKGTKIETFQAEVLGVLKNTSPGRDLILCRLSGLDLEKTGVIAGMSGSPVYIEEKLLGAVAYAWAYGKEPIAGITPFTQMHSCVELFERRDLAEQAKPARVGLRQPLRIGNNSFESVTVSQTQDDPEARGKEELWLTPLQTPLAATGFTAHSLKLLRSHTRNLGMVPMQGGGASAKIVESEKDVPLQPGGPLAVTLIRGDFDLSGIGTVTHIEGNRVYGWGHPFMSLGACEFPLMTGYIHTVYPRQTVSFKMGSPLKTVGVINADVSTGIAGWLDRKPDMLPMRMTVSRQGEAEPRTFNVELVRQRSLMPSLVFTALTNSVDMEGDLPDEMTADLRIRIEIEGKEPVIVQDVFSGFAGGRAPSALYSQVGAIVGLLTQNPYKPLRITRIDCETTIYPTRRTAEVESIELNSDVYEPGDTVKATVYLRPYKGERERVTIALKLPRDLPEGSYTAALCDDVSAIRSELRDNPLLSNPQTAEQILEAVQKQTKAQRTNLVMRIPRGATGVAFTGQALPDLPRGMVQIMSTSRRTGTQTISSSLVARKKTEWVIQGLETVKFTVTKNKKVLTAN